MENWFFGGLSARVQEAVCNVCAWTGFAFWVGMAARFFFPSKLTKGPWLTFCLGCVGACLGPLAVRTIVEPKDFNPISAGGFCASVAVGVATVALCFVVSFLFPSSEPEDGDGGVGSGADGLGGESDVERLDVPVDAPRPVDYDRTPRDRARDRDRDRDRFDDDYRAREDAAYRAREERERARRARRDRDVDYRDVDYRDRDDRDDDYREPRRRR